MKQQENTGAITDESVVHKARAWRQRDREAIASPDHEAKRAEYYARQQLREAVDLLDKAGAARSQ